MDMLLVLGGIFVGFLLLFCIGYSLWREGQYSVLKMLANDPHAFERLVKDMRCEMYGFDKVSRLLKGEE